MVDNTDIIIHEGQYDYKADSFRLKGSPVFRVEIKGVEGRYYATFNKDDHPVILSSGTTIISDGLPDKMKEENLSKWRTKHVVLGNKPADETKFAQDYGTILHALYGKLLRGDIIPITSEHSYYHLENVVREECVRIPEDSLKFIFATRLDELKKDLMSFVTWIHKHKVETLAVELMGASLVREAGTAIDWVGSVEDEIEGFWTKNKNGTWHKSKKLMRVPAETDFKSGKKGFYPSYALQLQLGKEILMEQYDFEPLVIYNFAPTAWKGTTPGFHFTNQNNHEALELYESVMQTGLLKFKQKPKKHKFFTGQASLDPQQNTLQYIEIPLLEALYDKYRPHLKEQYLDYLGVYEADLKKKKDLELMEFTEKVADFNKGG